MMHPGKIVCFAVAMFLMGCAVPSEQADRSDQSIASSNAGSNGADQTSKVKADQSSRMESELDSAVELPGDACTQEGYWSFFEAFTQSSKIRQAYTDSRVREAINPFRIALVEHEWVYVETDLAEGRKTLRLKETHSGNNFRVEYVRAEFGPDDEVIKTHGKTGVYEFQFKDGCWRLTNSIQ